MSKLCAEADPQLENCWSDYFKKPLIRAETEL
jgi:hypothetical protein